MTQKKTMYCDMSLFFLPVT